MNRFNKTKSVSVCLPEIADFKNILKKYPYSLLVYTDTVKIVKGSEDISPDKLMELRAFSETEELHICRVNGSFRGRIRTDDTENGTETEYLSEQQLLWGTVVASDTETAQLHDDRGIDMTLPFSVPVGERVFLNVRSYLSPDGFAFDDTRICGFYHEKAVEYNG